MGALEQHDFDRMQTVAVWPDLLTRLREQTGATHEALDQLFAPFQRDPATYLNHFLAVQLAGFSALLAACPDCDAQVAAMLRNAKSALAQDVADRACFVPQLPAPSSLHPLAVAYLVIGSRLGTEVLRRRLTDAGVAPMPRYFTPEPYQADWRQLCATLRATPADGALADSVVQDVLTGFNLFTLAATLARRDEGDVH
ncbi:hypothetical protein [Donghicola tyrosinivorans]|uniref:Heme oxygenase n=1 Tax=Donghicola tyrosinivorans TaxID=1652492 RepID=A0A2T0WFX6_9RHOB|nr:hypothetical protein [Donghicola tyrosinivorans]PRY85599.1 hypothetical protein CLV74_11552 [Donghicola tyrosinivorans]